MVEDTAESSFGEGIVEFDPSDRKERDNSGASRKNQEKIEMLNSVLDTREQVDRMEDVTLVRRRESGMWASAQRSDVTGETKADVLEALASDIREREG